MLVGAGWADVVTGEVVPAFELVQPARDTARIRSIQNPAMIGMSARFVIIVLNKFLSGNSLIF
jgi:hypothetical protein